MAVLGVIGGCGVYDIEGLENKRWVYAPSSFGSPSDRVLMGGLDGQTIAFRLQGSTFGMQSLGGDLHAAAQPVGIPVFRGGTYLVMEGPQFSSFAESELYRSWNCDVIGMTNMPEAKQAREAEICCATVAIH